MLLYIKQITGFRYVVPVIFVSLLLGACSPTAKLKNTPSVKQYAPEIAKFDSVNKVEDYPTDAILFTGSSSIRLWNTIEEDMAPYKVIRRGFGGAKIEDLAFYLHRIVYPHNFKALVFFAGTNNITGAANDMPADSILHWIKLINHQVRRKYPIVPIFWVAITPVNSRIKVIDKVFAMNKNIKVLCEESKHMYFIDTEKSFLGADGKPKSDLFISDQLHLNREGYVLWTSLIKASLDKNLGK